MHIHFNDEPRNLSNPDHLEAGGKGTWAEKMVYCEDCWYWPWQVREATSTGFELRTVCLFALAQSPNLFFFVSPFL